MAESSHPEERPATVHVHVHLAMTGSFPLRVADLLFTDRAVVVPEYEYLTPLSLAGGGADSAGEAARERYAEDGPAGLVGMAERTHRIPYDDVGTVRLFDGRFVRPKVAVEVADGPPYAYRIHAPVEVDPLAEALRSLGERRGFAVAVHATSGLRPLASLRRFLADR